MRVAARNKKAEMAAATAKAVASKVAVKLGHEAAAPTITVPAATHPHWQPGANAYLSVLKSVFLVDRKADAAGVKLVKEMIAMFKQLEVMNKAPATAAEGRPQVRGTQQVLTIRYQLPGVLQQQAAKAMASAAAAATAGASQQQSVSDSISENMPIFALNSCGNQHGAASFTGPGQVNQDMAAFAVQVSWPKESEPMA
jgi:hypothetical protein